MDTLKKQIMEINQLCNESDGLYHDIAQSYGLSDSIYWILYILYYNDCPVSQTELCSNWYYSKQTVNSSISAMTKKDGLCWRLFRKRGIGKILFLQKPAVFSALKS